MYMQTPVTATVLWALTIIFSWICTWKQCDNVEEALLRIMIILIICWNEGLFNLKYAGTCSVVREKERKKDKEEEKEKERGKWERISRISGGFSSAYVFKLLMFELRAAYRGPMSIWRRDILGGDGILGCTLQGHFLDFSMHARCLQAGMLNKESYVTVSLSSGTHSAWR